MERDCFIAHGSRGWLWERYNKVSDAAKLPICDNCGQLCMANPAMDIYSCTLCGEDARISIVEAPTSFRLLYQYNAGMMIKMGMTTAEVAPE